MARMRIGREFRLRLQEEAKRTNGGRITEEWVERSATVRGFRETALAVDDGNFRIPGKNPQVLMEDCSLRDLAGELIVDRQGNPVGQGYVDAMFAPNEYAQQNHLRETRLREAGDISVPDYTMFAGITGQLLINSTLKGWEHEEFKFTQAAGVYQTQFLDGERVPGVSLPYTDDISKGTEDLMLVKPQQPFPYLTMGESYIELPATELRGAIMGLDRTSVWGDRTGLVAQNAAKGAYLLGVRKEQRGLDVLIGADSVPYKEKFLFDSAPVTIDPYQYESGTTATQLAGTALSSRKFPFVNDIPNNPLKDWHFFEKCDQYASKLVDPNSGLPINYRLPTFFIPYTDRFNAATVLSAYENWRTSQTGLTAAGGIVTVGPSITQRMIGDLNPVASRMLRQQMVKASTLYNEDGSGGKADADHVYFYGDLKEAIKYSTNWNIKVIQAPVNSEAEFTQDIILRWRFDERGRWAWHNPRMIQRINFKSQDNS